MTNCLISSEFVSSPRQVTRFTLTSFFDSISDVFASVHPILCPTKSLYDQSDLNVLFLALRLEFVSSPRQVTRFTLTSFFDSITDMFASIHPQLCPTKSLYDQLKGISTSLIEKVYVMHACMEIT